MLSEELIVAKCEVQSNSGFSFSAQEYKHEEGLIVFGPNYDFYIEVDIKPKAHQKGEAYFETAHCGVRYKNTDDGKIKALVLVQPRDFKNLVDNDEPSYNCEGNFDTRYDDSLVYAMIDFGLDKAITKGISEITKSPLRNIDLSFHDGHTFSFDKDFEQM